MNNPLFGLKRGRMEKAILPKTALRQPLLPGPLATRARGEGGGPGISQHAIAEFRGAVQPAPQPQKSSLSGHARGRATRA
ncbi:hypothetical protein FQV27_06685 [Paracoccus aurantiacus]|uniref:Uncharacterized protein n=1 Tax=Paracoccus aurantiacus TaxID=2599412 RepID=A0A5C6S6X1_9RHOB|nr:hypothetical protein [Paracoccus aurantiacus]TXB69801.1 hypothetical protein FQV27_06685 [Paracoccus aurantiacus]